MEIFVERKYKKRKFSQPPNFYSSIFGIDGRLYVARADPNVYKTDRYTILSIDEQSAVIQSPADKKFPYHHSSILSLESWSKS